MRTFHVSFKIHYLSILSSCYVIMLLEKHFRKAIILNENHITMNTNFAKNNEMVYNEKTLRKINNFGKNRLVLF